MREIVPDILIWSWFSAPHGYEFNGHLLLDPTGNICIDPVPPEEEELATIINKGVSQILLTNRNHSRAANLIRTRTGAQTLIHPADADHARSQATVLDGEITVGETFGPLEVIDVAGKSLGEIALYWKKRRILIVGDAVIGHPAGCCGLLPERVIDDPILLRRNVAALLALDFNTLLVGDGQSILSEANDRLGELAKEFTD